MKTFDEWCVIGRDGFVVRVGSEERARCHAAKLDSDYPNDAPHKALRLVSMEDAIAQLANRATARAEGAP